MSKEVGKVLGISSTGLKESVTLTRCNRSWEGIKPAAVVQLTTSNNEGVMFLTKKTSL